MKDSGSPSTLNIQSGHTEWKAQEEERNQGKDALLSPFSFYPSSS